MNNPSKLKISVSGVRGVIGSTLSPKLISSFAASFGTYLGKGTIIIGKDFRPSGTMVEHAVIAGLLSCGCSILNAGVIPTPTLQVLVKEKQLSGAIAITASHNPMEWNALKFIGKNGKFLNEKQSKELLNLYNQEKKYDVEEHNIQTIETIDKVFKSHQQKIFDTINLSLIRQQEFKVAIDCSNGAGAIFSTKFLQDLNCKVITINDEQDGIFRRNPEPTPENLTQLRDIVKKEKCIIGFAQDPDADRLVLIDEQGNCLNENYTLALCCDHILQNNKSSVATNIATSNLIQDICNKHQQKLFISKVGEINVTEMMLKNNCIIGGESNGGVIYTKVHPCRDSFTAMALILELLAKSKKTVSSIIQTYRKYYWQNAKIPFLIEKSESILNSIKQKFIHEKINMSDGLRIDFNDESWVLIRPSNTEPILRIQAEALNQKRADELIEIFSSYL